MDCRAAIGEAENRLNCEIVVPSGGLSRWREAANMATLGRMMVSGLPRFCSPG